MLDIKFIRESPEKVVKAAKDKGIDINVEHLLEIDNKLRGLDSMVQKLREDRNRAAKTASNSVDKEEAIKKGKEIKQKLEKQENALNAVSEELKNWLYRI